MGKTKPFSIAKREVWEAYKRVKVNRGAAGIDGQTIEEFEKDLSNNLYKLWNRMMRQHTDCKWLLLYTERWLKAPVQLPDGSLIERDKGTPQGSVISPLLSNLFLHYVFDKWMQREFSSIPFERYADDVICHCVSEKQAKYLLGAIRKRMDKFKLELHPDKTRIVYCKDDRRKGCYPNEKFDFLGFTFRPRLSMNKKGERFVGFSPAVSNKAVKAIRQTIRSWNLTRRTRESLEDFARMYNPVIRGWINYYSSFYKSALYRTLWHLDRVLSRWARRKYKRLGGGQRRAQHWLKRIIRREPGLFVHWRFAYAWARR